MNDLNKDDAMVDAQVKAINADMRKRVRNQVSRMIWVTFQMEGIHRYPDAATDAGLSTGDQYDVSFLAHPHRHMFHFKVGIQVWHNNRDIEFIQFKRWLANLYKDVLQLNFKSCEMLCDDLYEQIATRYPNRKIEITVSEDGENGATLTYNYPPY